MALGQQSATALGDWVPGGCADPLSLGGRRSHCLGCLWGRPATPLPPEETGSPRSRAGTQQPRFPRVHPKERAGGCHAPQQGHLGQSASLEAMRTPFLTKPQPHPQRHQRKALCGAEEGPGCPPEHKGPSFSRHWLLSAQPRSARPHPGWHAKGLLRASFHFAVPSCERGVVGGCTGCTHAPTAAAGSPASPGAPSCCSRWSIQSLSPQVTPAPGVAHMFSPLASAAESTRIPVRRGLLTTGGQ